MSHRAKRDKQKVVQPKRANVLLECSWKAVFPIAKDHDSDHRAPRSTEQASSRTISAKAREANKNPTNRTNTRQANPTSERWRKERRHHLLHRRSASNGNYNDKVNDQTQRQ